jgi:hypothetical protein
VVSEQKPRTDAGRPRAVKNRENDEERRALRALIDSFRREPENDDDSAFYRNAGRLIARPVMKPQ